MILRELSIYASTSGQIDGMKTTAQSVKESVAGMACRLKRVRGAHLISAKSLLSSYLRHIMYFARNMDAI